MALKTPTEVPLRAEVEAVAAKIEALTGVAVAPPDLVAIEGMTRHQITDYIKSVIR